MSVSNGSRNVTTPRLGLNQPAVGADVDIWGDYLNANATILDNSLLISGGTMTGQLLNQTGTAGAPSFATSSSSGLFAQGASVGVSSIGVQVFMFSLGSNMSAVPLSMNNQRINFLAAPQVGTDAVNLAYLTSSLVGFLPLTGGTMEGPLNMGGNLITGMATPGIYADPSTAANKAYVDALIADLKLFIGTWQVAANLPDISDISAMTAGDYYIAVTADPSTPETAPASIPGIAGMTVHNGDMVIWDAVDSIYELIRGSPLTVAEAEELFVSKSGDTMTGPLTVTGGLSIIGTGVPGINYLALGAAGSNIAFGVTGGMPFLFQNNVAVDYLLIANGAVPMSGRLTLNAGVLVAGGNLVFGGAADIGPDDLSQHINLWGGVDGINVSLANGAQNYVVAGGGIHNFRVGGVDIITIGAGGLMLTSDPTAPLQAATKQYVDNNYLPLTGGMLTGDLAIDNGNLNLGTNAGMSWAPDEISSYSFWGGSGNLNITEYYYSTTEGSSPWALTLIGSSAQAVFGWPIYANAGLFLNADPTAPLQAATKQYVDDAVGAGGGGGGQSAWNSNLAMTTNTTAEVMMGAGLILTMAQAAAVLLMFNGYVFRATGTTAANAFAEIRYGTGAPPAQGAPITGTALPGGAFTGVPTATNWAAALTANSLFNAAAQTYWFDIGIRTDAATNVVWNGSLIAIQLAPGGASEVGQEEA